MSGTTGRTPYDQVLETAAQASGSGSQKAQSVKSTVRRTDEEKSRRELIDEVRALRRLLEKAGESGGEGTVMPSFIEGNLADIMTAVPVGIAYFREGRVNWANGALLEMFGFQHLEQMIGVRPADMYASETEYLRVRKIFYDNLRRGETVRADTQFRRADGHTFAGHIVISSQVGGNPVQGTIACISDISWRLKAEEDLRASQDLLHQILAASPVGLCRVENRTFSWVNQAMINMFGAASEHDFVGQDIRLIYATEDEYDRAGRLLYKPYDHLAVSETFATLRRKDGSVFDAQIRVSAQDASSPMDGTVAAIADVSWIMQAEEALLESERRFREILHNVHLVAVGLDVNGKITFCNDFLLDLTGWNRDEIIGHDWFSIFVPEEHLEKQRARFAGLTAGNMAIHGKTAIVTRDGERRIISWNNTVLRDPLATITGLASIGEDITDKIRADALLLQTERIKAVGEMAGAVAHNFNNLLQIVMGSAQLALVHLETGNVAQIRPGLEQIIKSSRLGAQTVQRLQEFARVRHEETDFEGKVFDLSPVVKQAVEMSEPWWKTNPEREGIRISLRLDLVEGCFVRGKENELFEVAVNLIKNAVEALSRGGEIRIRTGTEDGQVVMTVEDNGLGIPESEVRKVFEPFWTTKGLQGTGLGLSSCYGIVRRHKGEISVDSALGNGTRFTVKLPHEPAKIRPTDASEQSPELHLKILLVDDMPDILHMLENGLAEFGQTVYVASSGQEAVSIFQETPIDMVICDLGMEGMNGWQVSEKIREICRKRSVPKTPFLLLTGWGGQLADKEQLAAAGIDKVVSKPVTITRLLEAARDIIVESNGPH